MRRGLKADAKKFHRLVFRKRCSEDEDLEKTCSILRGSSLRFPLLRSGYTVDEIFEMFRALQNFNEEITRHHVDYIKSRDYNLSSCKKTQKLEFFFLICPKASAPLSREEKKRR